MNTCILYEFSNQDISESILYETNNMTYLEALIETLRKCNFKEIYINTQCKYSKQIAKELSLKILDFKPKNLSELMSLSADSILSKYFFFIKTTFPFISKKTINKYLKEIDLKLFDSGFSATSSKELPIWKNNEPLNFSINYRDTFNEEDIFVENGAFYLRTRDSIILEKSIYSGSIKPLEIPFEESINFTSNKIYNQVINNKSEKRNVDKDYYKILNNKTTWL